MLGPKWTRIKSLRNLIGTATLLALWTAVASAQPTAQLLTLDDCIRRAEAAQSIVSIARQQAAIAAHGITQARAGFLPQASISNLYGYNSPSRTNPGQFSYVALNGVREYSSLPTIGLDLDTSGRLRAQLARARADQDAASANVVLSQRDLKRAVTAAYYRVLLARHLRDSARDNLAEAQAFEKRSRLLAENGEVARADVVKASAQIAFFDQAINATELDAELANHELASFWTTDVEGPLPLADALNQAAPLPESAQPAGAPYLARPEFRFFDAQRRGFLADARRARADMLPQLSIVTQYGIDSLHVSLADRGYATFVRLNIPVFDWFRARSASQQFQLQAQQVDTNRQVVTRTFSKEYRDALARVDLLYAQIALTESQVKLSEENLRLSRTRYEGGEGSAIEMVVAQSQLAQARGNYFIAKASYLNARADLEVTSGK